MDAPSFPATFALVTGTPLTAPNDVMVTFIAQWAEATGELHGGSLMLADDAPPQLRWAPRVPRKARPLRSFTARR